MFNAFSLFGGDEAGSENKKDDQDSAKTELTEEESQKRQLDKDELLVYLMFKTELINVVVNGCMKLNLTEYKGSGNRIEIGYVTHLSRLAKLISKVCAKNEDTKIGLEGEFPDWAEFESTVLQPRIQVREGQLCETKNDKPQTNISFGDDDDLEPEPL